MRFYTDVDTPVWVRYYFVPEGTPYAAAATPFRPRFDFDGERCGWLPTELGEVYAATVENVDGLPLGVADPSGGRCGTDAEWAYGLARPPDPPILTDPLGTPCCCKKRPGFVTTCAACAGGALPAYVLSVRGCDNGVSICSAANGDWGLVYAGGCVWVGSLSLFLDGPYPVTIGLTMEPGRQSVQFLSDDPPVFAEYARARSWDCQSPITLALVGSDDSCQWPATVTVSPPPSP